MDGVNVNWTLVGATQGEVMGMNPGKPLCQGTKT